MLTLENVHFRHDPERDYLFRGVSLKIDAGEFVWIGGASGSGKSTLLRLINRLIEPTRGEIRFGEKETSLFWLPSLRAQIVLNPQEPVMLEGSVEDNLRLPFRFAASKDQPQPDAKTMRESLNRFHLDAVNLNDNASLLSVGQRMRLAILRSLFLKPKILLLDEPLAGLDSTSQAVVVNEVSRRHREDGLTVLLVSHVAWPGGTDRSCEIFQGRIQNTPSEPQP